MKKLLAATGITALVAIIAGVFIHRKNENA